MVESTKVVYKVFGICGSLRTASTNKTALIFAGQSNERISFELAEYSDLPVYNGDIEAKGIPESVKSLHAKILAADAILIGSPEYNYSISSALKNLIDWVSRIQPNCFEKKPVAILSATGGPSGGARS